MIPPISPGDIVPVNPGIIVPGLLLTLCLPLSAFETPIWIAYRQMRFVRQRMLMAVDQVTAAVTMIVCAIAGQSAKQIFQKIIVVPHRSADPAYSTVRLTTKTGAILTGIRSGETKDSVLFYDTSSLPPILRTIPKADITASARQQSSVMPNDYASRLTLQQLLDVVAFLRMSSGDRNVSVTLADVVD